MRNQTKNENSLALKVVLKQKNNAKPSKKIEFTTFKCSPKAKNTALALNVALKQKNIAIPSSKCEFAKFRDRPKTKKACGPS